MTEYILEFLSLSNLSYYELIWVCIGTFGQLIFSLDGWFSYIIQEKQI